jgi:aminoglycoside phosphotransferase (APT) family kinase protein
MYKFDTLTFAAESATEPYVAAPAAMIEEIHEYFVFVLKEKLNWMDASQPEMSAGGGHVVIRFERGGQRYIFRVAKHGLHQHKRTMLAYRHLGHLDIIPNKVYHDGVSLIERYASGRSLSEHVNDLVLKNLAQKLSQIHAIAAKGFGPLEFDVQGSFADASMYYHTQPAVTLNWAEADVSDDHAQQLTAALLVANTVPPALVDAPVCLGHGDLWGNNVLVTETDFKILDWDRIGAYPLERDLIFLLVLDFSKSQRELFFSSYAQRDIVNIQLLRWFAKHRVMRDRGLRLDRKLAKVIEIDNMPLSTESPRT